MTRILYIRHGETDWNVARRYQGQTDIPLNDKGMMQAAKVAERLAGEKIAAIYASDLQRAFYTAEKIAEKHELTVLPMREFREISFGEWEGSSFSSLDTGAREQIDKIFTDPANIEVPGGENFRQVQERAIRGVEMLVAKHPNETIAVVSHGAAIRTILCHALGMTLDHVWSIRQDNTAVNCIAYYAADASMQGASEAAIVELINDTHHLRD